MATLGGRVIACLEARYASELADLVTRHGGISYPAPCLREIHEPDAAETRLAVELISGEAIAAVVFLTGVGVETIAEAARRTGQQAAFLAGLQSKQVAVRGPKTLNAVRRLGARVDLQAPEPFTSDRLLQAIASTWTVRGQGVLLQRYGAPVPGLADGLRQLGARVVEVSPYRWERPLDEDAVVRLIEDLAEGWIMVLAATNAVQVDHLFEIARDHGCEATLRRALAAAPLKVAAQGLVCASAFARHGIQVDIVPPRGSMGALVLEIARALGPPPTVGGLAREAGEVAVFVARDVGFDQVRHSVGGLPRETRLVVRQAADDAAEVVRRATRVIIIRGHGRDSSTARLLRLARRYAKPVEVISAPR